ncbi:MAG: hypothetical protein ABIG95_05150 [Candidatus Woesearchaeota archaeon]
MPNKYGTITFCLPDKAKLDIEDLARRRNVSQAAICKIAISKFLEVENAKQRVDKPVDGNEE